jgi:hypothetical protein
VGLWRRSDNVELVFAGGTYGVRKQVVTATPTTSTWPTPPALDRRALGRRALDRRAEHRDTWTPVGVRSLFLHGGVPLDHGEPSLASRSSPCVTGVFLYVIYRQLLHTLPVAVVAFDRITQIDPQAVTYRNNDNAPCAHSCGQ